MIHSSPTIRRAALGVALALSAAVPALAQTGFDSGSNGSDGALSFPANAGTIVFDPAALNLDQDGDGVYHFTTINVPSGTTVRLSAGVLGEGRPVVWLASGGVTIAGVVDLNGVGGHAAGQPPLPAEAGAGGFGGGPGLSGTNPARSGSGPGGGAVGVDLNGGGGGHDGPGVGTVNGCASPGGGYCNRFLLPMVGGSGGGGGTPTSGNGGGGGGGGGAILIASSLSIDLTGTIRARGGPGVGGNSNPGAVGGGGSGGAIRLMAPDVRGTGTLDVTGGSSFGSCRGAHGRIRLEGFRIALPPNNVVPGTSATSSRPANVFLPANAPTVRISQIGSTAVSATPTGSYVTPDAVINESGAVSLTLVATNVPPGTQIQITLVPENGAPVTLTSTALTGTFSSSTATAGPVQIPTGFSRFFAVATWSP